MIIGICELLTPFHASHGKALDLGWAFSKVVVPQRKIRTYFMYPKYGRPRFGFRTFRVFEQRLPKPDRLILKLQ